jgi:hypothetical protein
MLCGCVAVVWVKAIEQGVFLAWTGSQALPFIAQGRSSGLHGRKRRKRRKRKAKEYRGGSLRGGTVLLLWVGPTGLVIDGGGGSSHHQATGYCGNSGMSPARSWCFVPSWSVSRLVVQPTPPLSGIVHSVGDTVSIRLAILHVHTPKHRRSWPTGGAMACLLLYCEMALQYKSHALEWMGSSPSPLWA